MTCCSAQGMICLMSVSGTPDRPETPERVLPLAERSSGPNWPEWSKPEWQTHCLLFWVSISSGDRSQLVCFVGGDRCHFNFKSLFNKNTTALYYSWHFDQISWFYYARTVCGLVQDFRFVTQICDVTCRYSSAHGELGTSWFKTRMVNYNHNIEIPQCSQIIRL